MRRLFVLFFLLVVVLGAVPLSGNTQVAESSIDNITVFSADCDGMSFSVTVIREYENVEFLNIAVHDSQNFPDSFLGAQGAYLESLAPGSYTYNYDIPFRRTASPGKVELRVYHTGGADSDQAISNPTLYYKETFEYECVPGQTSPEPEGEVLGAWTGFDPGDGREDGQPGDRIAVYCDNPIPGFLTVYCIGNNSAGFSCGHFSYTEILVAGSTGTYRNFGEAGMVSVGIDEHNSIRVAWNGSEAHGASGQGDYAKDVDCDILSVPCLPTSACMLRENGSENRWWADSWSRGQCQNGHSDNDWIVTYKADNEAWTNADPNSVHWSAYFFQSLTRLDPSRRVQVEDSTPPNITLCFGGDFSEADVMNTWIWFPN